MDLKQVLVSENGQPTQAWVTWKGDVDVLLRMVDPTVIREMKARTMKPQFRGHRRMEDQVDDLKLRDYYCEEIVKDMRNLTENGEPVKITPDFLKRLWDHNVEFQNFCTDASMVVDNFVAEKNG